MSVIKKKYSSGAGVGYAEETPFNSSLAYLERLERRWEDADDCKIAGEMLGYFRTLHTIYMNTHPFFDDQEKNDCDKIVQECEDSVDDIKN